MVNFITVLEKVNIFFVKPIENIKMKWYNKHNITSVILFVIFLQYNLETIKNH
mgnify:CR=1 FL=1